MTPIGRIRMVQNAIGNLRIDISDEKTLQDAVEWRLQCDGLLFRREYRLTPFDKIDFIVFADRHWTQGIGIEVKVDGTCPQLTRQVHRYLEHNALEGLLVVTNRARLANIPNHIRDKPVAVHLLTSAFV